MVVVRKCCCCDYVIGHQLDVVVIVVAVVVAVVVVVVVVAVITPLISPVLLLCLNTKNERKHNQPINGGLVHNCV